MLGPELRRGTKTIVRLGPIRKRYNHVNSIGAGMAAFDTVPGDIHSDGMDPPILHLYKKVSSFVSSLNDPELDSGSPGIWELVLEAAELQAFSDYAEQAASMDSQAQQILEIFWMTTDGLVELHIDSVQFPVINEDVWDAKYKFNYQSVVGLSNGAFAGKLSNLVLNGLNNINCPGGKVFVEIDGTLNVLNLMGVKIAEASPSVASLNLTPVDSSGVTGTIDCADAGALVGARSDAIAAGSTPGFKTQLGIRH